MDTLLSILPYSNSIHWRRICFLTDIGSNKWYKVLICYSKPIEDVLLELNDSELALWITETWLSWRDVGIIFKNNRQNVFYGRIDGDNSFGFICGTAACYGRLEFLKWLKTIGLDDADVRHNNNYAFRTAAKNGHLDVAKWLVDNFEIQIRPFLLNPSTMIEIANRGYLPVLKWFICELGAKFGLTTLPKAAANGHTEMVKWLVKHYRPYKRDIIEAFQSAAGGNHLDICKWLAEEYYLSAEDIGANSNYALRQTLLHDHIDLFKWMVRYFKLA